MNISIEDKKSRDIVLAKGALSLTLSVIFVKIIGFIYKVPLSHILGDEGMGYFNSAYTVFTFFYMLCSGGVPRAVSIMVTEMSVKGDKDNVGRILSVALKIFVSVGIAFTLIFIFFASFFANLIGNSLSAFSLVCIAPSLTFVSASGVLRGYLNGKSKLSSVAIAEMLDAGVKFIVGMSFALFAVRLGHGAPMISAFTVIGVTLSSFVGSLFLFVNVIIDKKHDKTEQKCDSRVSNLEIIKRIFRISIPITLSSAIMGISNIIDLGMIMKRLIDAGASSEDAIAIYGNFTTLAVPMLNLIMALVSPLSTSALPHLTEHNVLGNRNDFSDFCQKVINITALISIPISFAFLLFSKEILMLLFNDRSAEIAAPLLSLLAPSVAFLPMLTVCNTVLEASSHTKAPLVSMSIGAIFKIAVSYVLIGIPKIAIMGAPIGTDISYGISFIISAALMFKYSKVRYTVFLSLWKPFICSFLSVGISKSIYEYLTKGTFSPLIFIIFVIIAIVLYFIPMGIILHKQEFWVSNFVKINKRRKI